MDTLSESLREIGDLLQDYVAIEALLSMMAESADIGSMADHNTVASALFFLQREMQVRNTELSRHITHPGDGLIEVK